jgi:hypothetical protein
MAQQQHGFAGAPAREIYLQVVPEFFRAVESSVAAKIAESSFEHGAQAIDRLLDVARGFNFDQLLDGLNDFVFAPFEIVQWVEDVIRRRFGGPLVL